VHRFRGRQPLLYGAEHIHTMNTHAPERGDYEFAIGLLAGTLVGAGLTLLFAPRVSAVRHGMTGSAKGRGRHTSARVGETVDAQRHTAQDVHDAGQGVL